MNAPVVALYAPLNAILNFTGPSSQANGVFSQLVGDDSLPVGIRALAIQGLAG